MNIYLRQICLIARKLEPAMEELEAVFGTPVCYRDKAVSKFGLENALAAFGSQFVEVVSPTQENTAAGRYLDRRRGNGGYMVITQVLDKAEQEAVRRNAITNDVRIAYDGDRGDWHIMQLHPGDMRASFFEIEWDSTGDVTGQWHPAGGTKWMDHVKNEIVTAITTAELQSDDPFALAAHWSAVSGLPVEDRAGIPHIPLANADLRFVEATDGRGPGLGALDVRVKDSSRVRFADEARGGRLSDSQVMVCGTRINLIA